MGSVLLSHRLDLIPVAGKWLGHLVEVSEIVRELVAVDSGASPIVLVEVEEGLVVIVEEAEGLVVTVEAAEGLVAADSIAQQKIMSTVSLQCSPPHQKVGLGVWSGISRRFAK